MTGAEHVDLTGTGLALLALAVFVLAYVLVIAEESTGLRKSKPVVFAAGLIGVLVGIAAREHGFDAAELLEHNLLEYAGLLLFLLAAMTYVNTLDERNVFAALRSWMVRRGFSLRTIFWLTGALAFVLSPVLDNLTTALVLGAVALNVGRGNPRFLVPACINIVVAANAGGAFSPFGDITTLMVWQKGKMEFFEFFAIFFPSLVNWLVPAAFMYFAVPHGTPAPKEEHVRAKPGALGVAVLFGLTIVTAVCFKNFLHLPPALGMMLGLGYLQLWSYHLKRDGTRRQHDDMVLDSFHQIQRVEWDTLLFFFGIIFAVGGLGVLGYLTLASQLLYTDLGPTYANIIIGALSAIVDNIPLMFAVLTMDPQMSHGQWLLITLTCGVGGSMLSIGSAAGVALMGQAKGAYTFFGHLKWTWAIALGYVASIGVHLVLNANHF